LKILRLGDKEFRGYLESMDRRGIEENPRVEKQVRSILRDVRKRGDEALVHYTWVFDGLRIPVNSLQVRREEVIQAYEKIPRTLAKTLGRACRRIRRFHELMRQRSFLAEEKGIQIGQEIRPLESVGIYVPGGKASYPSTVLMAAIPARVAGVRKIMMTTPPQKDGISPAVLVAADLAGVDQIYRVGGAQAIAALAYGTKSIPKVDKIVGPGNRYVATAKQLVFGMADVDMVAGPSEILIISDGKGPASSVAADLISQAEHDEMAVPILITTSGTFAKEVENEIEKQLFSLKRVKIAKASLEGRGAILVVKALTQAIELANRIAPEHLEIFLSRPVPLLKKIKNAGAVFLGFHTPEAIGDYLAGPNHILPTAGTARFSSPLGVEDFIKKMNWMRFSKRALKGFEKDVKHFAEWEGLEGHYRAVQRRMKEW